MDSMVSTGIREGRDHDAKRGSNSALIRINDIIRRFFRPDLYNQESTQVLGKYFQDGFNQPGDAGLISWAQQMLPDRKLPL